MAGSEMIWASGIVFHLLLEALLDVERVGVGRIAEHLQDLALDAALLLGEQPLDFAGRHIADLDGSGDRGEVRRRRGDLAVEFITGMPAARAFSIDGFKALKSTAARMIAAGFCRMVSFIWLCCRSVLLSALRVTTS